MLDVIIYIILIANMVMFGELIRHFRRKDPPEIDLKTQLMVHRRLIEISKRLMNRSERAALKKHFDDEMICESVKFQQNASEIAREVLDG